MPPDHPGERFCLLISHFLSVRSASYREISYTQDHHAFRFKRLTGSQASITTSKPLAAASKATRP